MNDAAIGKALAALGALTAEERARVYKLARLAFGDAAELSQKRAEAGRAGAKQRAINRQAIAKQLLGQVPSISQANAEANACILPLGDKGVSDLGSGSGSQTSPSSLQSQEDNLHVTDGPPPAGGARAMALVETFVDGVGGTYGYPTRSEREAIVLALWAHVRARPLSEWREASRALGRRWGAACTAAGLPGPLGYYKAKDWLGSGAPAVYSNGGPGPKAVPQPAARPGDRRWTPADPNWGKPRAVPTALSQPQPPMEPHAPGNPDPLPAAAAR